MALKLMESPGSQIPFALCGSSEKAELCPVVVNTSTQAATGRFQLFSLNSSSQGSTFVTTATPVALDPLKGIREVVCAIKDGRSLSTTDAVSTLVGRAAASRGTPSDIEAWARKLADDSGDLND